MWVVSLNPTLRAVPPRSGFFIRLRTRAYQPWLAPALLSASVDNHIPNERLQQMAKSPDEASQFTDEEWQHFRQCGSCIEIFGAFVRINVRASTTVVDRRSETDDP